MTYRLPNLKTLRYFEAAARHLNFTTAASELTVTSGAVSQQVRKLEDSLGLDLFVRLPNGLELTNAGAAYLPMISRVFADLDAATNAVAPFMNAKKFRVGVSKKAAGLLPACWPKGETGGQTFVRDAIPISTFNEVQSDVVECILCSQPASPKNLHVTPISLQSDHTCVYLMYKQGFINCVQIRGIVASIGSTALH